MSADAGPADLQAAVALHQRGDLAGAIAAYEAVLADRPGELTALINLAVALKQSGHLDLALVRYEQALVVNDSLPELWFNFANALQAAGRQDEAAQAYRRAIALDPNLFSAHFNLANTLRVLDRLADAEVHYRRAITLQPDAATAHMNLGNVLHRQDRLDEAIAAHRRAVELAPEDPDAAFNLGNSLADAEEFSAAIDSYRHALRLRPDHADTWVNLGNASRKAELPAEARAAYEHALVVEPPSVLAVLALGRLLAVEHELVEAEAVLRRALGEHPTEPRLLRLLATVFYEDGQLEEAAKLYREALAVEPDHADTLNSLGVVLHGLGDVGGAQAAWERVVRLDPDHAGAQANLGTLYHLVKRHAEAIEHLRTAVRLDPDAQLAHVSLAFTLLEVGQLAEALAIIEGVVARDPEYFDGYMVLGFALVQQARMAEAMHAFETAQRLKPEHKVAISNALFASLYSDAYTAEEVTALHRELGERIAGFAGAPFVLRRRDADPDRPLRVGYLSPDLRSHPVGFFIAPILVHHRPDAVEVVCYSDAVVHDEITVRLRALPHDWRECYGWSDDRLGEQIQADGIDILVDLAGHTAGNRSLLLARKPAPIQALYLGYPCTSGLAAVNYLIADRLVCPPERARLYVEQVVALDGCFLCFQPQPGTPDVAPAPALASGHITFGSYNTLSKIAPATVALWARVLAAVPGARLALKALSFADAATRELYWGHFERQGIPRQRVDLLPPTFGLPKFLADYGRLDIALDPVPYGGGTTSCDALWMGVPLVTLAGRHFFGRMGVSLLHNVGLPELVAETPDDYVRVAAELAGDIDRLAALRAGLRQRMRASAVCDAAGFTRGLEAAYRDVWRRWCAAR